MAAGVAVGAWLLFSAWTWRRLARLRDGDGRAVFNLGVLGWSIPVWITHAAVSAFRKAGEHGNVLSPAFASELLTSALIGFPLALWGGYFFGVMMGAVFGPRRSI